MKANKKENARKTRAKNKWNTFIKERKRKNKTLMAELNEENTKLKQIIQEC